VSVNHFDHHQAEMTFTDWFWRGDTHTLTHFIDPTFVHRWMNVKHVRYSMLLNATWSKKHFK